MSHNLCQHMSNTRVCTHVKLSQGTENEVVVQSRISENFVNKNYEDTDKLIDICINLEILYLTLGRLNAVSMLLLSPIRQVYSWMGDHLGIAPC